MSKNLEALVDIFKELDLSDESASVYYEALKLNKTTVLEISRNTGLPRSSCYDILDRLKRIGLISTIHEDEKSYIIAETPEIIRTKLIKDRESNINALKLFEDVSSHLQVLRNQKSGKKIDVRVYEGFEAMRKILFEMLREYKGKELLNICQGQADKFAGLSRDPEYLKDFIREKDKYEILERAILEDMQSTREFVKQYKSSNFKFLLSPQLSSNNTAHIDKYITKNRVYIFNFEKDYAVVILDEFIAENEKISFNVLWNALKAGKYRY